VPAPYLPLSLSLSLILRKALLRTPTRRRNRRLKEKIHTHTSKQPNSLKRIETNDDESVAAYGDASKNQDAFVALRGLPKSTATAPNAASLLKQEVVLEAVLGRDSRFGAYGAPTNVKVLSDKSADADGLRILDVSFTTQGAQLEVDKHVLIGCRVVKAGASPVLALVVAGSSKAKWGESQEDAKTIVESFKAM